MKSRSLGIIFVVAVIVPSVLLAVLSVRAAGREQAFIERQLALTLEAEVTHSAGLANAEVGRIVEDLRAGIEVPTVGDPATILARWKAATPLVAVPFLLSPRYGILWPRSGPAIGEEEKRFLEENGDFLNDKSTTMVLQNIAIRYKDEILAEARKAEEGAGAGAGSGAGAQTEDQAAAGAAAGDAAGATTAPAAAAPSDSAGNQMALDAFAQSPSIQSKVYEEAREKGDQVSPRVAQPVSRALQNATVGTAALGTGSAVSSASGAADSFGAAEAEPAASTPAPAAKKAAPEQKAPAPPSQAQQPQQAAATDQLSQYVITSQLLSQIASQGDHGLIPRFIGEKLVFLFWERQGDGRIAGCEIAGSAFRERIAGVLPGTYTPVRIMTFLDENGAPLATPPDSAGRNWRAPFVSRVIGESLPRWEAAAYLTNPDSISAQARSTSLVLWILVGILITSVAGGGAMVLSSVYGEMRLAQKKATFVANVSHELKTPLTSISLFVDLLRQKRQPPPQKREHYLSLMASETERLTRLINNVLDFSAVTARGRGAARGGSERSGKGGRGGKGGREPRGRRYAMRLVDASRVAEEIVESQRVRLESRGFTLTVGVRGDAEVRGDPEALKQVLLNLLSNAEKYSSDRKDIDVEVEAAAVEQAVLIHVRDRGIGVPEKDRERIFREFYRVDDSLTSRVPGTGLGLTIARRIARDHGGDISCVPREGGGSDFVVRLPAAEGGKGSDRA